MYQWNFIDKIYVYDGSFYGLLTIVFDSYVTKTIPYQVVSDFSEINLFCESVEIKTDTAKAKRIFDGIVKNISYHALFEAYHVYLSNEPKKELFIIQYLLLGFCIGNKIDHYLSNDIVLKVEKTSKRVYSELHRLMGLSRFSKISDNMFYCKLHPDNNIIELLAHHFIKRLPTQNFMIHDKNRNIVLLYNTKTYTIVDATSLKIPPISQEEQYYQNLWNCFYHTIGIKERKNSRLRMQFMPKKYWQDLIEHVENQNSS